MSSAAQQRAYRARKSGRNGVNGRPPTSTCGSTAAYRRHLAHGETPCDQCKAAWAAHRRQYRADRKAAR